MPLRGIVARISFLKCTHRPAQYYSTKAANYENFKKLRAFPFKVTPEEAQKAMGKAAVFCSNPGILATLWAIVSPLSDFLRPVRFSAAYFPAWIVNAEIEADITYADERRKGTVIFHSSYLPGSHIPTLSAAPLWANSLDYEIPVPYVFQQFQLDDYIGKELPENDLHLFDPSLLMQHGEEVQCIPFTTSPFSLLDVARNLPRTHAVIDEDLKFVPSSLKVNLFSAYPVLLPIYIAKYEMKGSDVVPGSTLTMWTQAHCHYRMMSESLVPKFLDKDAASFVFKFLGRHIDSSFCSEVFSYCLPDDQVKIAMITFPASVKAAKSIEKWLQIALGSSTNISKLASTIDNDDDPRIRTMSSFETVAMRHYIGNERKVLTIKRKIMELMSAKPGGKVIELGPDGQQKGFCSVERALAMLQADLKPLLARKKELKPQWWTEWEIQSQESP